MPVLSLGKDGDFLVSVFKENSLLITYVLLTRQLLTSSLVYQFPIFFISGIPVNALFLKTLFSSMCVVGRR